MNRIALLLIPLMSCSCAIRAMHPVVPEGDVVVNVTLFEGAWEVTNVVNEGFSVFPAIDVSVTGPRDLALSMSSGDQVVSRKGRLADLGGMIVLSIENDSGSWNVVKIEPSSDNQSISVFGLDGDVLRQARDAGELAAAKPGMSFDDLQLELQESQAGLANFLQENPDSFGLQIASLRRVADGTP